ncbi:rhomboid family intramembrane serine protease [Marinobacter zhejiangensis]|uniref:Membrane associated serine protease, rhomboid family n=1 Tax=Marinobacter zhejiangensis TaxID=488535 RepID=A0A1I4L8X3_9GAMM|nr:rhomboid family intramembrane serine protease [Marinobacter zhejiangensis]SFL87410.1 Membrane associated serine protease, rhomboid family [Marinobacter zhejiangensis]
MLIVPAENTINWKRPPWVTLSLMLACFLVFVFYQSDDDRVAEEVLETYLESGLLELEAPVYENYLQRQIGIENASEMTERLELFQLAMKRQDELSQAGMMAFDIEFYLYMQDNQEILWPTSERKQWRGEREPIHDLMLELSSFRAGLVPAEMAPSTLITYQFLHGGWGHLIGNMVFLFLLGFTVEKALGVGRYLIAYLLCGVVSGLVFSAFSTGSSIPLVGASGSIAGLMGMYVAIYGRQTIRFFGFFWVYFNYFRAPALAMLPVWLGKEIYDHFFAGATGVAYMAHAGGLVAGAGVILLLGRSWFQVKASFYEPEPEQQDQRFTTSYAQAMASLGRMDFDLARRQFEALRERYPDRLVLLEHLYHIAKLRPDLVAYRDRTRELMAEALGQKLTERMTEVWQEYLGKGEAHHPLAAEDHNRVLFASLRSDHLKQAEKAFERLRATGDPVLVAEACQLLADEFDKRQMSPKARYYKQILSGAAPV